MSLSPFLFSIFSHVHTHTHTHAFSHTRMHTHTLSLSSPLALPVQHHLFITTVITHVPAQCSPKHFITQTCPSTFLRPPVQCGRPMREAPAAHRSSTWWQGMRSRCCQLGPASPAGLWAGHRGGRFHLSRHLHPCCTYGFAKQLSPALKKMAVWGLDLLDLTRNPETRTRTGTDCSVTAVQENCTVSLSAHPCRKPAPLSLFGVFLHPNQKHVEGEEQKSPPGFVREKCVVTVTHHRLPQQWVTAREAGGGGRRTRRKEKVGAILNERKNLH